MLKLINRVFIIIMIGFYLVGCTAVTKFETYKLSPVDNSRVALHVEDVEVTLYLDATEKRKLFFPLVYQKAIEKEPYRIAITIEGNLKDIEIVELIIQINSGIKNEIVRINRDSFENSPLPRELSYFYLKTDKYLNYPWKDIQEVEVIFDFYGIKDGQKTRYQARKIFKPHFESFFTNDAMSV